jgi:hypothetical protein
MNQKEENTLTGQIKYEILAKNPEKKKPKTIVENSAPQNPSQVFFGDNFINGVLPKKNPKK